VDQSKSSLNFRSSVTAFFFVSSSSRKVNQVLAAVVYEVVSKLDDKHTKYAYKSGVK
jgi:hypothetical protein